MVPDVWMQVFSETSEAPKRFGGDISEEEECGSVRSVKDLCGIHPLAEPVDPLEGM